MGQILRKYNLTSLVLSLALLVFGSAAFVPAGTVAAAPLYAASAGTSNACTALSQLDSSQACGSGQSTINKVVKTVTQIISVVLGIAAIIMIIIAGLKYITSGGDSAAVASAKRTLIYALVGLVIATLAEFIVHFVINRATTAG